MSAAPRRSAQIANRRMDPKCAKLPAIVAATTIGIPRAMPNAPISTAPITGSAVAAAAAMTGNSKGVHAGHVDSPKGSPSR